MKSANEVTSKPMKKFNELIKIIKKFPNTANMIEVISFIYKYNNEINNNMEFEIIIPFPRKVLYASQNGENDICLMKLSELNILHNSVLLVYPIE